MEEEVNLLLIAGAIPIFELELKLNGIMRSALSLLLRPRACLRSSTINNKNCHSKIEEGKVIHNIVSMKC